MAEGELLQKYNLPVPRYTSYPTVPYWNDTPPSQEVWRKHVKQTFDAANDSEGISLYIHLPYCESLCTYCGCNTRITVNHAVEMPYLHSLLHEWKLYLSVFRERPRLREVHLGGGTPTFFSPENLSWFLSELFATCDIEPRADLGFEGHPNNTTREHLAALKSLGFTRVSFGIQDFDPQVQDMINRTQSVEDVEQVTRTARELGYTSVNFDLIYGLPLQTEESIRNTFAHVLRLRPDRIAFYSYAHVPWMKPGQRKFTEYDLPAGEAKRTLYELGRELLETGGYTEIGMDHFALPEDALCVAARNHKLHRNFMGYTPAHTRLLVGLGASSISDTWTAFAQNLKTVEQYREAVARGEFPFFKGHELTGEDLLMRQHILNIMCTGRTQWDSNDLLVPAFRSGIERLAPLEADGLIGTGSNSLNVTEAGKPFLRNICSAFDARLHAKQPERTVFSGAV